MGLEVNPPSRWLKRWALHLALILVATSLAQPSQAQRKKGGSSPLIPGGNSKAPIAIDAERLEYLEKEQKFIYSGNVVARQGEATLKAPTMTVYLEKDGTKKPGSAQADTGMNDQIKRIETTGPVTITLKDQSGKTQVGTGDRGLYDKPANKVFLIGHPVLTQDQNIVRGAPGQTLEYDLNSGRANFSGAGRVSTIFVPEDDKKGGAAGRKVAPKP